MRSKHHVPLLREGGLTVEAADTPVALREAQELRHEVFCVERSIFARQADQTFERDEYDERSRHVVLRRTDDGAVIATARVVAGCAERKADCLPMQRYCCPSLFRNLRFDTLGEISRFAISKRARQRGPAPGPLLRLGLLHGILRASRAMGLTHWCALMEPSLLRLLSATGVHFAPLGPTVEAFGRRVPCVAPIDLTLISGRRRRPDFYNYVAGERFPSSWLAKQQTTRLEASRVV